MPKPVKRVKRKKPAKEPLPETNFDLIKRLPRRKGRGDPAQALISSLQAQSFQNQLDTYQKVAESLRSQLANAEHGLKQRDDAEKYRLERGDSLRTYLRGQHDAQLKLDREWLEGEYEDKLKTAESKLRRQYVPDPDKDTVVTDVKDVNVPNPPPAPDRALRQMRSTPSASLLTGVSRKLEARRKGATAESIKMFKDLRFHDVVPQGPVRMEEVLGTGTVALNMGGAVPLREASSRAPMVGRATLVARQPHPLYRQVTGGIYPPLPDQDMQQKAARYGEIYGKGVARRKRGDPLMNMATMLSTLTEGPTRRARAEEEQTRAVRTKFPTGEAEQVERQYGADPDEVVRLRKRAPQVIVGKSIRAMPTSTQVTSGGQISIELPQAHGVDTRSIHLMGTVSVAGSGTGAYACCLPRGGVAGLWENIQISANGQQVGGASCPFQNVLNTILTDWTSGVQDTGKQSVYHGGGDVPAVSGNTATTFGGTYDAWGTYTPTPVKAYDDVTTSPYTAAQQGALSQGFNSIPNTQAIPANGLSFSCNMLGSFLATVQPQILPTYLMGRVAMNITLAQPSVLVQGSTASTTPQFKLGNLRIVCTTYNFGDLYEQAQRAALEAGEIIEMPFTSYWCQPGPPSLTIDQSLQFAVSVSSIDGFHAVLLDYDFRTPQPVNTVTNNSQYFNFGRGDVIRSLQWSINGSGFPTTPFSPHELYSMNEADLSMFNQGKGVYRNLSSSRNFLQHFFTLLTRTNWEIPEAPGRVQTGFSSLGQNAQLSLNIIGDQNAISAYQSATGNMPATGKPYANYIKNQALIFTKCTSVLCLGAGASINVIP